jgi:exopolysaccharide biosynthesis polyprenyl glycosylphosphotransferase
MEGAAFASEEAVVGTAAAVSQMSATSEYTLDRRTLALLERRRSRGFAPRRGWLIRRALALADVIGLTLAFAVSLTLFGAGGPKDDVSTSLEVPLFLITLPVWVLVANLYGLYSSDEERADHSTADDLVGVFHLVTLGSWTLFLGLEFLGIADPTIERLVSFWLGAIVFVTGARAVARACCRRTDAYLQNTVIVGAGDVGHLIASKIAKHPEYGINMLGFVDGHETRGNGSERTRVLGPPEHLREIVQALDVERVIIGFSNEPHEQTIGLIRSLHGLSVQIDIVPRLFEVFGPSVGVHTVEGMPMISLASPRLSRSALLMKRTLDITLSLVGLFVLAPLFVLAAIAIKLDSRGPVFFRQVRRGHKGRTFRIFKFRTMSADAEERKAAVSGLNKHTFEGGDPRMFKIHDDPRVTRVGRVLRRYSLDEFPQLLNVLSGDMSLVGPRPLILEEDNHVLDWRRRRLDLKPGITGLWQVLGRDGIPFEEMVMLDYLYVTTWSLLGDVKLILRTIPVFFRAHDA